MSQSFYKASLAAGVLLAAIAGCKTAPQALPDMRVGDTAAVARPAAAPIEAAAPRAPQVRLQLRTPKPMPGYRVQDIPTDWDEAVVSFHSPTVSAPYSRADHARTVAKSAFTQGGGIGLVQEVLLNNAGYPMKTLPDAVSPDGSTIYSAWSTMVTFSPLVYDNQLFAFSVANKTVSILTQNQLAASWLRIARTADKLVIADNGAGFLQVYDSAGNFITRHTTAQQPFSVEAQDNTAFYVSSNADRIYKVNLSTGENSIFVTGVGYPEMNLSDGKLSLVRSNAITVYDMNNGSAPLATIAAPGVTSAIAVGNRIYACFQTTGTVTAYELADPTVEIPVFNGLDKPSRIMYANGWIYVCENGTNHRLLRIDIATAGNSAPTFEGTLSLPALRPAADYEARIYLKRAGQIAGSAVVTNKQLKAGANTILLTVPPNINAGNAGLYGGATSVTITTPPANPTNMWLKSGLLGTQPGVARVEYRLSGSCYGDGQTTVLMGKTTGVADQAMWLWHTAEASEQYNPTLLKAGTARVDVDAYDNHGDKIHTANFTFPVVN